MKFPQFVIALLFIVGFGPNLQAQTPEAIELRQQINDLQQRLNAIEAEVPKTKFLRVHRVDGNLSSLDTAIVRYERGDQQVDLIGAVHVGEGMYYTMLNNQFTKYDALLYELVAEKGQRPEVGEAGQGGNSLRNVQGLMTQVLGLKHQLGSVDYTPENFIHADMSPADLKAKMDERGDSPMVLAMEAFVNALRQQNLRMQNVEAGDQGFQRPKEIVTDQELFMGLLQAFLTGEGSPVLKRYMALQMEDMESQVDMFSGGLGKLILDDRNAACFEVLEDQLDNGVKRIGIFYGAAHLPDMEERLLELGFKKTKSVWLPAWNLR